MTWWAVGTAAVGAIASYQNAHAANQSHTTHTDQVTSQVPYDATRLGGHIDNILAAQEGNFWQGTPQLDSHGNVYYVPHANFNPQYGDGVAPGNYLGNGTNPGGGGSNPGSGGGSDNVGPQSPNSTGNRPIFDPSTGGGQSSARGGRAPRPVTGPPTTGTPAAPVRQTPANQAQDIFGRVADAGMRAGNTATVGQGRQVIGNILGTAGSGANGGDSATATGFEGYNPILDRQTHRLETDADNRNARDLIMGFLGEDSRGGGGGSNGSGGGGGGNGNGGNGNNSPRYNANAFASYMPPGSFGSAGSGSGVPDTMATPSYFADQTRRMMNEGANNTELQALIDSMNADEQRSMYGDLASLDASSQGSGRFGGDMFLAQGAGARRSSADAMLRNAAGVRVGDREARRTEQQALLQGVNARDLGLLNANVSREGIAAGERSASASASAAAAANQGQIDLARRGQDLSAMGSLMDSENFGLGQLTDIGGRLSTDRLAATGMIPGLEGVNLQGLSIASGAGGGLTDLAGQANNLRIANASNSLQRQGLNQQLGMFNIGQSQQGVNDYLRTVLGIGGLGGVSTTTGTNVVPGLGVSPSGAALQGAAGGALAGYGATH